MKIPGEPLAHSKCLPFHPVIVPVFIIAVIIDDLTMASAFCSGRGYKEESKTENKITKEFTLII